MKFLAVLTLIGLLAVSLGIAIYFGYTTQLENQRIGESLTNMEESQLKAFEREVASKREAERRLSQEREAREMAERSARQEAEAREEERVRVAAILADERTAREEMEEKMEQFLAIKQQLDEEQALLEQEILLRAAERRQRLAMTEARLQEAEAQLAETLRKIEENRAPGSLEEENTLRELQRQVALERQQAEEEHRRAEEEIRGEDRRQQELQQARAAALSLLPLDHRRRSHYLFRGRIIESHELVEESNETPGR